MNGKKKLKKIMCQLSATIGMVLSDAFRSELHIDFRTQCIIMTLAGGKFIANDVLKMRKVIEFQSL